MMLYQLIEFPDVSSINLPQLLLYVLLILVYAVTYVLNKRIAIQQKETNTTKKDFETKWEEAVKRQTEYELRIQVLTEKISDNAKVILYYKQKDEKLIQQFKILLERVKALQFEVTQLKKQLETELTLRKEAETRNEYLQRLLEQKTNQFNAMLEQQRLLIHELETRTNILMKKDEKCPPST